MIASLNGVAGEQGHDPDEAISHNERISGEGDHALALCPGRITDARIVADGVREVRATLRGDQADLVCTDGYASVRAVQVGVQSGARLELQDSLGVVQRPDTREGGILEVDQGLSTPLQLHTERVCRW